MTQRYAHHSPESLRDGVSVLDPSSLREGGTKSGTVELEYERREWNALN
jgi:hypothetical protein